jgi:pyruvate/2-oxoglutarate dehydrogenase complex dihydrolipoamide dehydrogenase (E3) component/uncharacterized membrane protein YdjX (TVP38/TMEM64 family)
MLKKLILLMAAVMLIAVFYYFGLNEYLSLDQIKARQAEFAASYQANPLPFLAGFFLLYVAVTAVSFPGAVILTLAAGAFFGLITGTILVSFASTIGATLAFLSSRFLLRDWVTGKFGQRLRAIDDGLAKDGAFYLFSLRLIPVVPFFLINLLMGLTKIRAWTFYWVSQIGMLAGTLVYVNAGTQLGQISSTKGLLTPGLIGSFIILAGFPWLARSMMTLWARRKIYHGWKRPSAYDRNLLVIGGGAAGLVSAYIAALGKAKVTLVEAGAMGGDCLNTGCVPSKALIKAASVAHTAHSGARFGVKASDISIDFPAVMSHVLGAITAIKPHDSIERYSSLGVDVQTGYARLIDPWTVEISNSDGKVQRLTSRAIVVATGAAPTLPPIKGLLECGYLTSETLWGAMAKRNKAPARLAIIGGGAIGCELAQAFARLGSRVTLLEAAPLLLSREEPAVSVLIRETLEREGVQVRVGANILSVDRGAIAVEGHTDIAFDDVIVATGRKPRVTGFGLEELGLLDDGKLVIDGFQATKMPHIFVAGDVAGRQQLTHGASHEAWHAAVNALAAPFRRFRTDYRVLPRVTYTDPEIASVGLTEAEATKQGIDHDVTDYDIYDLDRAICEGATGGFVKILTTKGSDKILGATIAAPRAGEMLAEIIFAMRHGMGLKKLMPVIHAYPGWAEANKFAAGQYQLARQPVRLQNLAKVWFDWRRG